MSLDTLAVALVVVRHKEANARGQKYAPRRFGEVQR